MWLGGARADRGRVRVPLRALAPRLGLGGRPDLAHRRARDRRSSSSSRRPYAGLFHEVSSDPVFAFLLAWWAGAVVRAWSTGSTGGSRRSALGVALLTLCRPAAQVALLACVLVPLVARRGRAAHPCRRRRRASRPRSSRSAAWAAHNAVRYDDFTVARGSKAWVPFFRVGGRRRPGERRRVAPAGGRRRAARPHAAAVREPRRRHAHVLPRRREPRGDPDDRPLRPASSAGTRTTTSCSTRRSRRSAPTPGATSSGVADTFWDFLSQRYAPEPRERPVPIPDLPAELTIDGKPFPAPITVSPLVQAVRYGFVWCPTDDLERCVVPRSRARRSATRGRRGATTSWSTRSATGTRSCRRATRTPGSPRRAAPRATAGRDRSSGSPSRRSRSRSAGRAAPRPSSC